MTTPGAFDRYLAEIRKHRLLDREEEAELARRAREGDPQALERLVNANLRFVVSVARRYARRGVPLDELVNEGNLGLIRAARRFDESRGVRFVSYAVWWIRQAILGALARQGRIVRVPDGRLGEARRVAATARRLSQRLGRRARVAEIAAELGLAEDAVQEAIAFHRSDLSLDAPGPRTEETSLLDRLSDGGVADPTDAVDRSALGDVLRHGLLRLPEREAEVVRRYYGLDGAEPATLAEIGSELGVSRERAGVIRERALARLRTSAAGRDLRMFRCP